MNARRMVPKNSRIYITLEPHIHRVVQRMARSAGVSLTLQVRNLVGHALELREDAVLEAFAKRRRRTFVHARAVSVEGLRTAVKRLQA
ncbi:MAG TPA: hypothetical protein VGR38_11555 [Candidatus Polarisedimenticolia bacterium]|nr:hypothetical protein [Candidatus Polarisedimenticolia bacterium]